MTTDHDDALAEYLRNDRESVARWLGDRSAPSMTGDVRTEGDWLAEVRQAMNDRDWPTINTLILSRQWAEAASQDTLSAERLAAAVVDNIDYDEDGGHGPCRYCQNLYQRDGHSYDCVVVIARAILAHSDRDGGEEPR